MWMERWIQSLTRGQLTREIKTRDLIKKHEAIPKDGLHYDS